MRSALSTLRVARPRSLDHALALLHGSLAGERLRPLAGGTDLFVYLNAGVERSRRFLDLSPLRELRGVRVAGDQVRIGALTTFTEIRESRVLHRRFPALVAAAGEIGGRQIQNRATLGGNIANGSPAGDSLPVLLALEAVVLARSVRGPRELPFAGLFRGYRDLALEPDELITAVGIPLAAQGTRQFFRKVGTRRAQSISKVVCCGLYRRDRRGDVALARLAWGSVAPVPLRSRRAEAVLLGVRPSRSVARRAREALLEEIAPIDDVRSERDYRLFVAGNLLEQFLRVADPRFARG